MSDAVLNRFGTTRCRATQPPQDMTARSVFGNPLYHYTCTSIGTADGLVLEQPPNTRPRWGLKAVRVPSGPQAPLCFLFFVFPARPPPLTLGAVH